MFKKNKENPILRSECSYEGVNVDTTILSMLTLLENHFVQDIAEVLVEADNDNLRVIHGYMGVKTEIGELIDAYKKSWFYQKELDEVNILEEVFDILWYVEVLEEELETTMYSTRHLLNEFAKLYNKDLDFCTKMGIEKLKIRYPDKYTDDYANERDLKAERELLESSVKGD